MGGHVIETMWNAKGFIIQRLLHLAIKWLALEEALAFLKYAYLSRVSKI